MTVVYMIEIYNCHNTNYLLRNSNTSSYMEPFCEH